MVIIEPHYFPSVTFFALIMQADEWTVDFSGRYRKQTWRNRALILGPNSPQNLIIPVKHTGGLPFSLAEARTDDTIRWQSHHRNAIKTAYGKAPWFEIYGQELLAPLNNPGINLAEITLQTLTVCQKALGLKQKIKVITDATPHDELPQPDLRDKLSPDAMPTWPKNLAYRQVFNKPFLEHASAIDLIFNEGPAAKSFLSDLASYLLH